MFNIDFNSVVIWLLPNKLRTIFNVAWLKALISQIVVVYNNFISYRTQTLYKLNHNSQVCYIESALNDAFDSSDRRIYITDAGGEVVTLINRDTDLDALIISDDVEWGIIIHNDSAYYGGSYDFIVNIPYQFSEADLYRLKGIVDYYKLAGKRFDVVVNI